MMFYISKECFTHVQKKSEIGTQNQVYMWKIDKKKETFGDLKNSSRVSEECSKRSENIINRKIVKFYIEAISQKFSQLRQKIFFRARS